MKLYIFGLLIAFMKNRLLAYTVHIVLAAAWLGSCVKPYQPDTKSIGPVIIVEGMITDQPGPYAVNLSYTTDYTFASLNYLVRNANVIISDNLGNSEVLKEISPGAYQTAPSGIQGVVGRTYKISIRTTDNKQYVSKPELLKASPPIQKLYYEYKYHPYELTNDRINTWDVYLDTKDPESKGDYYRWKWKNYEAISACYVSENAMDDGYYRGVSCCSLCWDINQCYSNCISLRSDATINGNVLSRQYIMSVLFTSFTTYYVEVEQQALSQGAYNFFNSAQKLIDNTGGIFDAAPLALGGNITCTSNPNEAAFGYFGAAGISVQAIKVDRSTGAVGLPVSKKIRIEGLATCVPCINSIYRTPNKPRWWDQ